MADKTPLSAYLCTARRSGEARRFVNLLLALAWREWQGRYRRSFLGPLWAILQPLCYMLIFTFLRGVLEIKTGEVPYAIFSFSALVPWTFFANAVSRCAPSVAANSGIVKKIAVRREIFPMAAVLVSLADFFIAFAVLGILLFILPLPPRASYLPLFLLPLLVLMLALLALGVGLFAAAFGTYKNDVLFVIPFAMQFWLLATPILYPLTQVPERWRGWYSLNPMCGLIDSFRNIIIGAPIDSGLLLLSALAIALIWAVAWPIFRHLSQYFADVL